MTRLAGIGALMCAAAFSAHGQSFTFSIFENQDGVSTSGFNLNLDLNDGGSYVDFVVSNNSSIGGIATMILFESSNLDAQFGGMQILSSGVGPNWEPGSTGRNPPGSLDHYSGDWTGTLFNAEAMPSPVLNGIHMGESMTVRFDLGSASYDDVLAALQNNDLRLVAHVQSLGPSSVWGVVPSPASFSVLGLAGIWVVSRRRR